MKWMLKTVLFAFFFVLVSNAQGQQVYFKATKTEGAKFLKEPKHNGTVLMNIPNGRKVRLIKDSIALYKTRKDSGVIIKFSYFGQMGYGLSSHFNYEPTGVDIDSKVRSIKSDNSMVSTSSLSKENETASNQDKVETKPNNLIEQKTQATKQTAEVKIDQPEEKKVEAVKDKKKIESKEISTPQITESGDYYFVRITSTKGLNVRSSENPKSKVIGSVPYNTKVKVFKKGDKSLRIAGKDGSMLEIEFNGIIGYIFSGFTEKVQTSNDEDDNKEITQTKRDTLYFARINTEKNLNLRATSNPKSTIITTVPPKTIVPVLRDNTNFIKIGGRTGKMTEIQYKHYNGYVFSAFIDIIMDDSEIDVKNLNPTKVIESDTDTIYFVKIIPENGLNLRKTNQPKSKIIETIPHQTVVPVLSVTGKIIKLAGKRGKMLKINHEGKIGYIFSGLTEAYTPIDPNSIDTLYKVKITAGKLNLRNSDKLNAKVIKTLIKNQKVAVIREGEKIQNSGQKGRMLMIYDGQDIGYIFSAYTKRLQEEIKTEIKDEAEEITQEKLDTLYFVQITSSVGLRMRSSEHHNSMIFNTIKPLEIVPVIEESEKEIKLAGKTGQMLKVVYGEDQGYIYSGFTIIKEDTDLSKLTPLYKAYISTSKSLNLRVSEDPKSAVITSIPSKDTVKVIYDDMDEIKIGSKTGKMIQVVYNNEIGYVFSPLIKKIKKDDEVEVKEESTVKSETTEESTDTLFWVRPTVSVLNIREGKESNSKKIGSLKRTYQAAVIDPKATSIQLGKSSKMIKISMDNTIGYASAKYLEKFTPISLSDYDLKYQVKISSDRNLNLRSTSSSNSRVLTSIPPNTELWVIDDSGEDIRIGAFNGKMLKVIYGNKIGYIYEPFTEKISKEKDTKIEVKETVLIDDIKEDEKKKELIIENKVEIEKVDMAKEVNETQVSMPKEKTKKDTLIKDPVLESKKDTLINKEDKNSYSITKSDSVVKTEVIDSTIKDITKTVIEPLDTVEEITEETVENIDTLYLVKIISQSKLNLRASTNPYSQVVTRLESLSDVAVIEETQDKIQLKGKIGKMLKVYDGENMGYIFSPYVRKHQDLVYNPTTFDTIYLARIASQNNLNLRITNDPGSAIIKSIPPNTDIAIINENSPLISLGGRTGRMIQVYDGEDVGFVFSVFTKRKPTKEEKPAKYDENGNALDIPKDKIIEEPSSITKDDEVKSELDKFIEQEKRELERIKNINVADRNKSEKVVIKPSLANRIDDEIVEVEQMPYDGYQKENDEFKKEEQKLKNQINEFNKVSTKTRYISKDTVYLYKDANFKSGKIGKLQIGTQVSVVKENIGPIVKSSKMTGRFIQVRYKSYKGYIFEPFTAYFEVPKEKQNLSIYKVDQMTDPIMSKKLKEHKIPSDYIKNEDLLVLSTQDMRYAYKVCQQLFDIPEKLLIPSKIAGDQKIINNPEKNPDLVFDNIHIKMDNGEIEKITYNKKGYKVSITIFIVNNGDHVRVHFREEKI